MYSIQALVLHDNVSYISLESPKPETVKIKIQARPDVKGLSLSAEGSYLWLLLFSEDEKNLAESFREDV